MKRYKIPVSWQMYGYVTVEADTAQHAAEIAESDMGIGLPDNGSYVEASWEVDWDVIEDASYGKACEERLK
jgi:hypothetical protein|tara:strand:- start:679 stop:891 length:213 start_codon:yes stop_codon:yes gene_type:complete